MADHVLESGLVEERSGEDVQRVEPAAGLIDVFDDEVGREMLGEPLGVLERVVDLGERHRARLEPTVEHLGHPAHGRLSGGIVGIGTGDVVDERSMEVVRTDAEVALDLVERTVHVDAGVVGIVAPPDRDR